jgi:hypothetical protein
MANLRNGQVFYVQEETKQLEGGFVFSIKFRPNDDFLIIMPITGEKVKVIGTFLFFIQPSNNN